MCGCKSLPYIIIKQMKLHLICTILSSFSYVFQKSPFRKAQTLFTVSSPSTEAARNMFLSN